MMFNSPVHPDILLPKQNLGSLKNSGLEILIEGTPVQNKNFSWTTSWNNAYLKTEVL